MARILVVDDEPDICRTLKDMLEGAGHEVEVAGDGDAALRLHREHPADLIITDIFMPGKEGIETIMALREDFPGVKIIAMSGGGLTGNLGYLPAAQQLGAIRSLSKPFLYDEVLRVVGDALAS